MTCLNENIINVHHHTSKTKVSCKS